MKILSVEPELRLQSKLGNFQEQQPANGNGPVRWALRAFSTLYFYFIELSKTHMPSKLVELTSVDAVVYGSFALAWGLDNTLAGHQDCGPPQLRMAVRSTGIGASSGTGWRSESADGPGSGGAGRQAESPSPSWGTATPTARS